MKTILLVGAGHANLEIIKGLNEEDIKKDKFILISPNETSIYSGLLSRYLMGDLLEADLKIKLADYAKSKNIEFICAEVLKVDRASKSVLLSNGICVNYDIISINLGGTPVGIKSEAPASTIYLKPLNCFIDKWNEIEKKMFDHGNQSFVIVGGGAAAVEVAASIKVRLIRNKSQGGVIHLITKGARLGESYSDRVSILLLQALNKLGVRVHFEEDVQMIHDKFLILKNGEKLNFDYVLISTALRPVEVQFEPPLDNAIPQVNIRLEISDSVFGSGDFVTMKDYPALPKSGVIAVLQGKHLIKSIRRQIRGLMPLKFVPPKNQLNILLTGADSALATKGLFYWQGTISKSIKFWIDQGYMSSFK